MFAIYPLDNESRLLARKRCRAAAASDLASSSMASMTASTTTTSETFECRHCHRSFSKQYNLLIHERTHKQDSGTGSATGSRSGVGSGTGSGFGAFSGLFTCNICGKAFRKAENMKNHRVMHSPPSVPKELKGFLTECISY